MAREAVQITISDLTSKVEAGWKKPALAEHYGLPVSQVTSALQAAGLRIRKFHHPKFILVDDTVNPITDATPSMMSAPEAEMTLMQAIAANHAVMAGEDDINDELEPETGDWDYDDSEFPSDEAEEPTIVQETIVPVEAESTEEATW